MPNGVESFFEVNEAGVYFAVIGLFDMFVVESFQSKGMICCPVSRDKTDLGRVYKFVFGYIVDQPSV